MDNDRNAPATKGDVQDLEVRLEVRLQDMGARLQEMGARLQDMGARLEDMEVRQNERHEMLRAEMGHSFHELRETIADSQTELLKAFYNYTQSTDLKLHDGQVSDANLRERLSVVERRITELERKVGFPEHPTQ